jgi:hypothetical protein
LVEIMMTQPETQPFLNSHLVIATLSVLCIVLPHSTSTHLTI